MLPLRDAVAARERVDVSDLDAAGREPVPDDERVPRRDPLLLGDDVGLREAGRGDDDLLCNTVDERLGETDELWLAATLDEGDGAADDEPLWDAEPLIDAEPLEVPG